MKKYYLLFYKLFFVLLCSAAQAQIGSAPFREGKTIQSDFELIDTSMVWLAIDFENVSNPSFQLNDLSVSFETTSKRPLRDFFHFAPFKRDINGRAHYMVGLSLPVGNYKITNISGRASSFLIFGKMTFDLDIPVRISAATKNYYLGNISIQNISTENSQLQRSGDRFPLIDQAISGFGNSTLSFALTDNMANDIQVIKGLFSSAQSLQNSVFEKKLIPFIKIPYTFGQGLEPLAVRLQTSSQNLSPEDKTATKNNTVTSITHSEPVPVTTNFAPNLNLEFIPQTMSASFGNVFVTYKDMQAPKALAISGFGMLGIGTGADAMKRAIENCAKYGKPCQLYAVDNNVVWDSATLLAINAKKITDGLKGVELTLKPTGFANIEDFSAVPNLSAKGKELYVEWLSKLNPKAVAISDRGAIARGYGENATTVAITNCERFGRKCKIYGFNDSVVFEPFPTVHDLPVPAESGYARLNDVLAPPYGTRGAKVQYENWLEKQNPKAIAISNKGLLRYATGTDSMVVALENCKKATDLSSDDENSNKTEFDNSCKLYAIDNVVVFTPFSSEHSIQRPSANSAVRVDDITSVPKLGKNGKEAYQFWLTRGKPKAFALADNGNFSYKIGPTSQADAIKGCETLGRPCKLYAVDDTVVWEFK